MPNTVPFDPIRLLDAIAELATNELTVPQAPDAHASPATAFPRQSADLRIVLCTASAEMRRYAADRGCELRLELPAEPLMVQASSPHLEIALMNLVRNAIDANATAVTLLGEADHDRVEVRIDDDGGHIVPDSLGEVDDPATLVHWSADLAGSIARSIVEEHGGRLDLVAHPGRGTTACLTLPRESEGVTDR